MFEFKKKKLILTYEYIISHNLENYTYVSFIIQTYNKSMKFLKMKLSALKLIVLIIIAIATSISIRKNFYKLGILVI